MKFLALKTKFKKGLFLLGLISVVSFAENAFGATRAPQVQTTNQTPEAQVENILTRCLFARNEIKPFSFYIDELIRIVTTYKDHYIKKSGNLLVENFIKDMNGIRNTKNPILVGKTLGKYKQFTPASLKKKKFQELLAGLKFRLAITEDGSVDETVVAENEGYIKAFIGYCKLLLEMGKEYFSKKDTAGETGGLQSVTR